MTIDISYRTGVDSSKRIIFHTVSRIDDWGNTLSIFEEKCPATGNFRQTIIYKSDIIEYEIVL